MTTSQETFESVNERKSVVYSATCVIRHSIFAQLMDSNTTKQSENFKAVIQENSCECSEK